MFVRGLFSFFLALLTLDQHTSVEPFGSASDYDVSEDHIVYTTKDLSYLRDLACQAE
jgi:hypothetical protein